MTVPHLYKVSSTQWACSPSKDDKHILRCKFGDSARAAYFFFQFDRYPPNWQACKDYNTNVK